MPRRLRRVLPCLLLAVLAAAWSLGCSGEESPADSAARALARNLRAQLAELSKLLAEPLARGDQKASQEVLRRFFAQASRAGKPIQNGVLVLDAKGVTFAERYPAPGHPEGVGDQGHSSARNYASYQVVRQALDSGRTRTGVVYLAHNKLYVVCHPLGGKKRVGVLILGILGTELEAKLGVSGEQFLAMDLSP